MADIRCQMCGKLSSDELEVCPFCQARLKPLHINQPMDESQGPSLENSADENLLDRIEDDQGMDSAAEESLVEGNVEPQSDPADFEVKEWLAGLDKESGADSSDSLSEGSASQIGEDSDDWLTRLEPQDSSEVEQGESLSEAAGEQPEKGLMDWLGDFKDNGEAQDQPLSESDDYSALERQDMDDDWLDRLQSESDSEPEQFDAESKLDDDVDLGDLEPIPDLEQDSEQDFSSDEEIETPDWLKNIQAETMDVSEESMEAESQSPEWMSEMQSDSDLPGVGMNSEEHEMPAWLREIGADSLELADDMVPGSSMDLSETSFGEPDLENLDKHEPSVEEQKLPDADVQPLEAMDLDAQDQVLDSQSKDALLPESDSTFDQPSGVETGMDASEKGSSFSGDAFPEPASSLDFSQKSDLDDGTLEDISGELESVDLPEWLKELKNPEVTESDELMDAETAKKLDAIPEGELPGWVQDMQPVESMLPPDGLADEKLSEVVENTGPLAGLAGVLPPAAEQETLPGKKPYQESPVLTGEQNQQVELFKQILSSESEPIKPPVPEKKASQRFLRWLVSILLIAAVLVPLFTNFPLSAPVTSYPPEMIHARQVIFSLPEDSPVLLVFDYEPAYSAELEAASSAILGELINKNSRLAFLSTSPTGMVLADHLMQTVLAQGTLMLDPRLVKLGYLSGNVQGMADFASDPVDAVPMSTDHLQIWGDSQLFHDVQNLSDFSAMILLTENSETARNWIEQVGGNLGTTPFLVVASAQAEPMIRPYYESGQVAGLVTGLAGGKAYEQAAGTSGLSGEYWNAFRSGLFMIEAIIIVGALWSFLASLRDGKLTREEKV
ncbi:MAG: hypothetical protein ACK2TS_08050 [Anaerolineales bacterium]